MVLAQRGAGCREVGDRVGEADLRRQLDGAVEANDVHGVAAPAEELGGRDRVLRGHP